MRIIDEAVTNYTFQPLMTLITQIFHLYYTERLLFICAIRVFCG